MAKRGSLSRGEKTLLWSVTVFVVVMGLFACWWQWANTNPVVIVPTPAMPNPNARDFYIKACSSFVPYPIATPTVPYNLAFDQWSSKDADRIGTGPGIAKTYTANASSGTLIPSLAELQGLVRVNAPAFAMLRKGFQYEYRDTPSRSFNQLFPHYSKFRGMARNLATSATAKRLSGDWNGAVNDLLDTLYLGQEVTHGAPLIGDLVGISIQAIGRSDVWTMIDHLDAAQARAAAKRMETITAHHTPYADILQEEEWGMQASLMEVFHQPGWRKEMFSNFMGSNGNPGAQLPLLTVSKREIMDGYTKYMNAMIANAKLPYVGPKAALPQPKDPVTSAIAPVFDKAQFKDVICQTQNHLLTVAFSLRAYDVEHGQYPKSLKELVPSYLKAIPTDPFTNSASLSYGLVGKKYVLYSIGPDGQNNGGTASADGKKQPKNPGNKPGGLSWISNGSTGDIVAGVNLH